MSSKERKHSDKYAKERTRKYAKERKRAQKNAKVRIQRKLQATRFETTRFGKSQWWEDESGGGLQPVAENLRRHGWVGAFMLLLLRTPYRPCRVYGGEPPKAQLEDLARGCDLLVQLLVR